jgi:hypothetical protein
LIVIDDECPNESGRMADQILREYEEDHASEKHRPSSSVRRSMPAIPSFPRV